MSCLQGTSVIYCHLRWKWCWKGNSIFTRTSNFQRVRWVFYFSVILNWIAPEHDVTLNEKSQYPHLYKLFLLCAVCEITTRWAEASGFSLSVAQVLEIFRLIEAQRKLKRSMIWANLCSWILQRRRTLHVTDI